MKYYINIFIIFSFVGFIAETIMKHLFFPSMDTHTLYGPWIPIYGLGTCLIIVIMRFIFNHINTKRFVKGILIFIISAFTLTILELIGGILMEKLTGNIMWDYSDMKFNIGNYISLEMASVWGTAALIITYFIKPKLDEVIRKIPSFLTYSVFIIYIIDMGISIFENF